MLMNVEQVAVWRGLLGWLDGWFEPEKAGAHGFDARDAQLFEEVSAAWRETDDKIAALESVSARVGRERVRALVDRLCADETSAHWTGLASREGRSLDDLVRLLWEPLPALGFEFEMQRTTDSLRIHCTACPHNELAAAVGGREWLYALVCSTDFHVCGAFDPLIRFERTKTLMQGDAYCDHSYFVESQS
jgi:predicted ArsR family transcriptional regulator